MKHNTPLIAIELSLFGDDFNPELLTKELLLKPTRKHRKGEFSKNGKTTYKENCWALSSGEVKSFFLDELANETLLHILKPKVNVLKSLISIYNLEAKFNIVAKSVNGETPALYFDRDFLDFTHQINAEIDIDLYIH